MAKMFKQRWEIIINSVTHYLMGLTYVYTYVCGWAQLGFECLIILSIVFLVVYC